MLDECFVDGAYVIGFIFIVSLLLDSSLLVCMCVRLPVIFCYEIIRFSIQKNGIKKILGCNFVEV